MIEGFLSLYKLIRYRSYYIDERVFRLHCLFTSAVLFFFCIIITTKQLGGDPIDCDTNRDSVKSSVLNTYCLIHYTYTVREGFFKKIGNYRQVVAPGVRYGSREEEIPYHYYQWMWFLFFLEGLFFYIPRWLWKGWESATIAHLVTGFNEFMTEKDKNEKKEFILKCLLRSGDNNQLYGRHYLFCLFLAFINVLLQMSLIDCFFNGDFYAYGLKVFFLPFEDPEIRRDALIKVLLHH